MAEIYDPLSYDNLARSVVNALLSADREPLPPDQFDGSGVYAIYYNGALDYVSDDSLTETPVYVGKAVPPGARRGGANIGQTTNRSLYLRLRQHASSIEQATNLALTETECRYQVVVPVWIALAEQFLLNHFNPLWNTVLDGFGNHNPGRGRSNSARPRWDIMHPGRPWASSLRADERREDILSDMLSR